MSVPNDFKLQFLSCLSICEGPSSRCVTLFQQQAALGQLSLWPPPSEVHFASSLGQV